MDHNHTQLSDDKNAQLESLVTEDYKPGDVLNDKRSYLFESMNRAASLIPEPEEIPTEELEMECLDDDFPLSKEPFEGREVDMTGMSENQESLLNSANSGLDVAMVQTILKNQSKAEKKSVCRVADDADASIVVECTAAGLNAEEPEFVEIADNTDEVYIETIGQTGTISTIIENHEFPQKMELGEMLNPADFMNDPDAGMSGTQQDIFTGKKNDTGRDESDWYIENDCFVTDNQSCGSISDRSVLICSTVGDAERLQSKTSDSPEVKTSQTLTTAFRKIDPRQRALQDYLKQLIVQYPLISEYELFERIMAKGKFSGMKMTEKRLVKILERLGLGSSYERFRYFVKA